MSEYRSQARGLQDRAPIRAAGFRAEIPAGQPRLYRRRSDSNPLNIDTRIVPEGYSYEWKTAAIYGRPETAHMNELREQHWVPVPASRHPELATPGEETIRLPTGEVLMERPKYLSDEAHFEQIMGAMGELQKQEEKLFGAPPGTMTRDHPSVRRASYVTEQKSPGDPIVDTGQMIAEP